MSQSLNNANPNIRDYGATTSTSNLPDVNFSGFSPTEFMSLSEDIAYNINSVTSSCKSLEKFSKIIGTSRDQQATRDKIHNIHTKTNALIETTSKDLQRLTSVVRRGDKQQKLQLEKLTNGFGSVVEKYSAIQQRISSAMKQTFVQSENAQLQDEQTYAAAESDRSVLLQRQTEIQAGLQFEQDMLVDREIQFKQIEADILDVNSIMRTVSSILQAQAENVGKFSEF